MMMEIRWKIETWPTLCLFAGNLCNNQVPRSLCLLPKVDLSIISRQTNRLTNQIR